MATVKGGATRTRCSGWLRLNRPSCCTGVRARRVERVPGLAGESNGSFPTVSHTSGGSYGRRCGGGEAESAHVSLRSRHRVIGRAAAGSLSSAPVLPFRVGHGFDLHRLEEGYKLIIGGIEIPHTKGCQAHSDGDVLLHTLVDAITGALGLPDIGQLFPDNDPQWKGANSDVFMVEAVRLMHEEGYELGNVDATIILQRPKVSPHKAAIKENLCKLLGAHPSVVNVKAKTHEKVDSIGEGRSVACHAVVLLLKK